MRFDCLLTFQNSRSCFLVLNLERARFPESRPNFYGVFFFLRTEFNFEFSLVIRSLSYTFTLSPSQLFAVPRMFRESQLKVLEMEKRSNLPFFALKIFQSHFGLSEFRNIYSSSWNCARISLLPVDWVLHFDLFHLKHRQIILKNNFKIDAYILLKNSGSAYNRPQNVLFLHG